MTTEEAMWRALAKGADNTTKLVLADLLEEQGDTNTAIALRWCVKRKRWPRKASYSEWEWWFKHKPVDPDDIPYDLWDYYTPACIVSSSVGVAIRRLGRALAAIRAEYSA